MSIVEDRLSAALAARADLVRPEDLTHAPPVAPPPSLLRRPTTYLLAAAACAAAVAVPFVVPGDGSDRPAPPATSPAPELSPLADVEGADWPRVQALDEYDVDGDGVPDRVVTRTESGENLTPDPWRVEARLSSGGVYAVLLDGEGWENNPIGPVDLDGDGGDEILYYNGRETAEIGVLDLVGPVLADLEVPDDPGITSALDGQGRLRTWWREDGGLFSRRSVEGGFVLGDGGKRVPGEFAVDVWSWALVEGELRPTRLERQCVRTIESDTPVPCS